MIFLIYEMLFVILKVKLCFDDLFISLEILENFQKCIKLTVLLNFLGNYFLFIIIIFILFKFRE